MILFIIVNERIHIACAASGGSETVWWANDGLNEERIIIVICVMMVASVRSDIVVIVCGSSGIGLNSADYLFVVLILGKHLWRRGEKNMLEY